MYYVHLKKIPAIIIVRVCQKRINRSAFIAQAKNLQYSFSIEVTITSSGGCLLNTFIIIGKLSGSSYKVALTLVISIEAKIKSDAGLGLLEVLMISIYIHSGIIFELKRVLQTLTGKPILEQIALTKEKLCFLMISLTLSAFLLLTYSL